MERQYTQKKDINKEKTYVERRYMRKKNFLQIKNIYRKEKYE